MIHGYTGTLCAHGEGTDARPGSMTRRLCMGTPIHYAQRDRELVARPG
jgi:hypothetical protein